MYLTTFIKEWHIVYGIRLGYLGRVVSVRGRRCEGGVAAAAEGAGSEHRDPRIPASPLATRCLIPPVNIHLLILCIRHGREKQNVWDCMETLL